MTAADHVALANSILPGGSLYIALCNRRLRATLWTARLGFLLFFVCNWVATFSSNSAGSFWKFSFKVCALPDGTHVIRTEAPPEETLATVTVNMASQPFGLPTGRQRLTSAYLGIPVQSNPRLAKPLSIDLNEERRRLAQACAASFAATHPNLRATNAERAAFDDALALLVAGGAAPCARRTQLGRNMGASPRS
jgi:hypothetical protein